MILNASPAGSVLVLSRLLNFDRRQSATNCRHDSRLSDTTFIMATQLQNNGIFLSIVFKK